MRRAPLSCAIAGLAMRARIVLAAADGETNTVLAQRLRFVDHDVRRWRNRFVVDRCDGLQRTVAIVAQSCTPRLLMDHRIATNNCGTIAAMVPGGWADLGRDP